MANVLLRAFSYMLGNFTNNLMHQSVYCLQVNPVHAPPRPTTTAGTTECTKKLGVSTVRSDQDWRGLGSSLVSATGRFTPGLNRLFPPHPAAGFGPTCSAQHVQHCPAATAYSAARQSHVLQTHGHRPAINGWHSNICTTAEPMPPTSVVRASPPDKSSSCAKATAPLWTTAFRSNAGSMRASLVFGRVMCNPQRCVFKAGYSLHCTQRMSHGGVWSESTKTHSIPSPPTCMLCTPNK